MEADGAQGREFDPLIAEQLRSTGEALTDTLLAPLYMVGFLDADLDRPAAPRHGAEPTHDGTLFYGSDPFSGGLDGFVLGGQAALYDPSEERVPIRDTLAAQEAQTAESLYGDVGLAHDLNPTFSHEQTMEAFLDGDAYLAELADVDGERWAARQDPWDGP